MLTSQIPSIILKTIRMETLILTSGGVMIVKKAVVAIPIPKTLFPPIRAPSHPPSSCVLMYP